VRVTKNGVIPSDNWGQSQGIPACWAKGLRNGFRSGWDLPSGRFFIAEVGGWVLFFWGGGCWSRSTSSQYETVGLGTHTGSMDVPTEGRGGEKKLHGFQGWC
jgi:hypothetical protein